MYVCIYTHYTDTHTHINIIYICYVYVIYMYYICKIYVIYVVNELKVGCHVVNKLKVLIHLRLNSGPYWL
jgi:hypothetical protein